MILKKNLKGIDDQEQFLKDYYACQNNAKDTLGILYNKYTGITWITSCMVQKGYSRALIEESVKKLLGV